MKKYLIITLTFGLFLFSCNKSDVTPIAQATTTKAAPALPQNHCYTITNTETVVGFMEYRLIYTDCSGVSQNVPLPFGQTITICSTDGVIQTNFAYSKKDMGVC
jgi:hypothetical protein